MSYILCDEENCIGELTNEQVKKLREVFDFDYDHYYIELNGYYIWKPDTIKEAGVDSLIMDYKHKEAMQNCKGECETCIYDEYNYMEDLI